MVLETEESLANAVSAGDLGPLHRAMAMDLTALELTVPNRKLQPLETEDGKRTMGVRLLLLSMRCKMHSKIEAVIK